MELNVGNVSELPLCELYTCPTEIDRNDCTAPRRHAIRKVAGPATNIQHPRHVGIDEQALKYRHENGLPTDIDTRVELLRAQRCKTVPTLGHFFQASG